ncbi:hypothetical protein CROQUDRAFT_92809 [Cronartium quercuum f. sp. fusiforme G11]|uniref:Uncharacterized protein n=1 Tax=Cronartium quercuum f. sp. fusiforme G11 TaxID=708437 RepID=A0A9P6TD65_9BASI|nr:hypothetical protein CROQUDRAFT_92809 [Cronartium quercuum f. sp. fusiforme G11]
MRTQPRILIVAAAVSYMMNVVTGVNDIGETEAATEGVLIGSHLNQIEQPLPDFSHFLWEDGNLRVWRAVKNVEFGANQRGFPGVTRRLADEIVKDDGKGKDLSAPEVSKFDRGLIRQFIEEVDGPDGRKKLRITSHMQTVNHSLQQLLRNFIRVLESVTTSYDKKTFEWFEESIINKIPSWPLTIGNGEVRKKLGLFLDHVMKYFAADQLWQHLHRVETLLSYQRPKIYSLGILVESDTVATYGMAFQAYMNFVERAEHLLTTGFMDSRVDERVLANRLPKESNPFTNRRANHKFRFSLMFNLKNLNELKENQYPKHPFHGLPEEQIQYLKDVIKTNRFLATPKAITRWEKLRKISTLESIALPEPPEPFWYRLNDYYQVHREEPSERPALHRISHSLQILLDDLGTDQRSKLILSLLTSQIGELLSYPRGGPTPKELEGTIRNMVLFNTLTESFGTILLELDREFPRKEALEEPLVYYMRQYWLWMRFGHWVAQRGEMEFLKIELRLTFQLGQSYGLYLGCYSHFQKMFEQVANPRQVDDYAQSYVDLKGLLSQGFFPPQVPPNYVPTSARAQKGREKERNTEKDVLQPHWNSRRVSIGPVHTTTPVPDTAPVKEYGFVPIPQQIPAGGVAGERQASTSHPGPPISSSSPTEWPHLGFWKNPDNPDRISNTLIPGDTPFNPWRLPPGDINRFHSGNSPSHYWPLPQLHSTQFTLSHLSSDYVSQFSQANHPLRRTIHASTVLNPSKIPFPTRDRAFPSVKPLQKSQASTDLNPSKIPFSTHGQAFPWVGPLQKSQASTDLNPSKNPFPTHGQAFTGVGPLQKSQASTDLNPSKNPFPTHGQAFTGVGPLQKSQASTDLNPSKNPFPTHGQAFTGVGPLGQPSTEPKWLPQLPEDEESFGSNYPDFNERTSAVTSNRDSRNNQPQGPYQQISQRQEDSTQMVTRDVLGEPGHTERATFVGNSLHPQTRPQTNGHTGKDKTAVKTPSASRSITHEEEIDLNLYLGSQTKNVQGPRKKARKENWAQ